VIRALVIVVVAALVVLVVVLHHLLFRRPLPRIAGTVTLAGLRAPVRITRDRYGVPHIDAESLEDAAFGLGFAHAQDRGWQMELNRRVASGRLAEIAGTEGLAADRLVRRVGLRRAAAAEAAALEGEGRRCLEAYAAGVTAVLCGGQPRPLELLLLRINPEPWTPADSLAVLRLVSMGLALDWDIELQRLQLLQALGPERAAALDIAYPEANPTVLAATAAAAPAPAGSAVRQMYAEASRWLPSGSHAAASNSWVVDGSVTATGRPMLCNDPHLPPTVPSIWYEAHLRAGDGEAAGVTFAGLPFVVIGHNQRIAWGFTNSFADVQDLVIEEFDDVTGQRHRTEDGWEASTVHIETIRVKGGADVVEEVVETRHGPVIDRFEVDGVHRGLALSWSALHPGRTVDAALDLLRAATWDEFRGAINRLDVAPQNAVYADVDGHVGYVLGGRIPVRRGAPSRLPVAGWSGDAMVVRHLGPDEVPQVLDPPEHVIVTANNRVVGAAFPHHISFDWMNGYRAQRLEQLLRGRTGMTPELMAATQLDIVCLPAREVVELLGGVSCSEPLAEEARQGLRAWGGVMDPAAAEPLVYEAFLRCLAQRALEPTCGPAWRLLAGEMSHPVFDYAGNVTGRLTPWLLQRWRDGDSSVLAPGDSWEGVAAEALERAVADLRRDAGPPRRWEWGRIHAIRLSHVLSQRSRLLGVLLDAGRVEIGGDTDTVLQTASIPGRDWSTRGWAPSWRQILDVGSWDDCTGIHLPGQSGHPGSRHHRDMVEGWRRNRQHPLAWSRGAVEEAAVARLLLQPLLADQGAGEAEGGQARAAA